MSTEATKPTAAELVAEIKALTREKPTAQNGYGIRLWSTIENKLTDALAATGTPQVISDETIDWMWTKIQRADSSWEPLPHRKLAREVLALASQGAAPTGAGDAGPGWKLVPAEPTEEMMEAGRVAQNRAVYRKPQPQGAEWAGIYYRAMVAAAPQQPAEAAPGEIDALRADAERYREFIGCGLPITFLGTDYRSKSELDAAIDAALANNKGAT